MEKFNVISILFLSIPEFALSLYISFLIIMEGKLLPLKDDAEDRIKNVFKLGLWVLSISSANGVINNYISDMGIASVLTLLFGLLTIKAIYKISWVKSILAVLIFSIVILSAEIIIVPPCINIFFADLETFYMSNNLYARILMSLPFRLYQIIIVVSCWNLKLVYENVKLYKINKWFFMFLAFLLVWIESSYAHQYLLAFKTLELHEKVLGIISCTSCGLLNYMIFLGYIKAMKAVAKHLYS